MENIRVDGEWTSIFVLCQAHLQLEADYNESGIVRERPSNARRNASTGVQLHRMKYSNPYGWVDINAEPQEGDDPDDEAVRFIYLSNVLKWGLPFDADAARAMERMFVEQVLEPYQERINDAKNFGHYPASKAPTSAPQG